MVLDSLTFYNVQRMSCSHIHIVRGKLIQLQKLLSLKSMLSEDTVFTEDAVFLIEFQNFSKTFKLIIDFTSKIEIISNIYF